MGERRVASAIDAIYEAALGGAGWEGALERFADLLCSAGATLEMHGPDGIHLFARARLPEAGEPAYVERYFKVCPRLDPIRRSAPGEVVADYSFTDERGMDRSEFYRDFLAPYGFRYFASGTLLAGNGRFAAVTVQRTVKEGHVGARESALLEALAPRFRRALVLQERLAAAGARRDGLLLALERAGQAALLLGRDGRIAFRTHAAAALLARRHGLVERDGRLAPAERASRDRLARAIGAALRDGPGAGGELLVAREGGTPLWVMVVALPAPSPAFVSGEPVAAALVLVHDPDRPVGARARVLQETFALTPAETALAAALLDGLTPRAYAARRRVSVNTIRTQLASLRAKLGAGTQAQVVARLARALPPGG
jgi:DNA-binding CsgD family transcriptional regulator